MTGQIVFPIRFGKYILQEKLVAGGMAQLYKAKITGSEGFEKPVVIKQILPHLAQERDLVSSFINEANLAALLHHPNIVQIYDFGEKDGSHFISMEYLKGIDLRAVLGRVKEDNIPMGLGLSLYISSRICSALDYAHKFADPQGRPLKIIHRDISPQNIFLTYDGDVKLIDFGIAKALSQSTHTQYGLIKGKVAYMSPEQASGGEMDHRSDIFSAGIILYEMITSKKLFSGDTLQVLSKVQNAVFTPPEVASTGYPTGVYAIINRALAKKPAERYQSSGDMLNDLEECMFEYSLRSSERGLSKYLKELFSEEITRELSLTLSAATPQIADEEYRDSVEKNDDDEIGKRKTATRILRAGWTLPLLSIATGIMALVAFVPRSAPDLKHPPLETAGTVLRASLPDSNKNGNNGRMAAARAADLIERATRLIDAEPGKALNMLVEAVGLDAGNLRGHTRLGFVYYKLKDFPNAAESYRKASEIDSSSSEIFFYLGSAYEKMNDYKNAVANYKKAVALSPSNADACFNLGYIYLGVLKNYAGAEEMYTRAVDLSPPYVDEALFNLAVAQYKQGRKKQCLQNLKRALEINPDNKRADEYLRTKFKTVN